MDIKTDMSTLAEPFVRDRSGEGERADTIDLIDVAIACRRHFRVLVGLPLAAASLAAAISYVIPPTFTSTTILLPPQQSSSGASAALGQLGALAGAMGGLGSIKTPGDTYVAMLESRTIADRLIHRYDLKGRYRSKTSDAAREALSKVSQISVGKKDGLITVSVSDNDPQFAAQLANAYVEELAKLTQTLAISEASQRRLFFEKHLKDAKEQLAASEVALRHIQEKTGLLRPEGQVQAVIANMAQLRGAIAAKEVQLNTTRTFATSQNPEVVRLQEELRSLKGQLTQLEQSRAENDGSLFVSARHIPKAGVEYVRALRDMKYHESMFEMLAKQYEMAKLDEAKDASVIQILDAAVPAERKSKPRRDAIVVAGFLTGLIVAMLYVLLKSFSGRLRQEFRQRQAR